MNTSVRLSSTPTELAFGTWFGLPRHQAMLLTELYERSAPVFARRVHICALRRALETEAIDTHRGAYRLTEIGRLECQSALAQFTRWINGEAA